MSDIKRELNEKIAALRAQLWAIEAAETDAVNAALIGKCFRDRNSYSCPESDADYWDEYRRVLSSEEGSLVVLRFGTDSMGESRVTTEPCYPASCLGQEISFKEYAFERDAFLARVAEKVATP